MSSILLLDYANQCKRYSLEVATGAVTEAVFANAAKASENAAGFGALRTIGLLRNRRRVFVAAYADEKTWLVRIAEKVFDFADASLNVNRKGLAPFVKRFTISRSSDELLSLMYFYADTEVWPDNADIFSFIERTASTPDSHEGFAYVWRAKKQGRDISSKEFINELEHLRRIRAREVAPRS